MIIAPSESWARSVGSREIELTGEDAVDGIRERCVVGATEVVEDASGEVGAGEEDLAQAALEQVGVDMLALEEVGGALPFGVVAPCARSEMEWSARRAAVALED